ncbi:Ankyrin repeat domain containing protein [Pandoravirus salinus]|uniref:Ankyrin repeat domain containing protein n=1 Tax=Pandoravirus salinus TaxID=1349410 RepID=S4W2M5_9VIRU|nr:ankyrin repeat domain [Pandoravirus salinus]AGO84450.1 Ankyrin repeat domain containing protein [Pandoravirus salinus]
MQTASAKCLDYALRRHGTIWATLDCGWHCAPNDVSAHAACIRILREHNIKPHWTAEHFTWTTDHPCAEAAAHGHLDCLRYAHENGCRWDDVICTEAAAGGHVDALRYAHENGCPWDENTCANAAKEGHVDCLRYAHEHECPWDVWTWWNAARSGNLDCLQYAHENGLPWSTPYDFQVLYDYSRCTDAITDDQRACLRYIRQHARRDGDPDCAACRRSMVELDLGFLKDPPGDPAPRQSPPVKRSRTG